MKSHRSCDNWGTHGWVAVTVTSSTFPQSGEVMPPAATTTLDPESAKSVVSPEIANVTALPSPPVVLTAETTVPAATAQGIVGFDGVNTTANLD
jgi:hypothetical protein